MARNIEIKASVRSVPDIVERAVQVADGPPVRISQDDTFFGCDAGRLKLRAFPDGTGELIFYRRADAEGPKTSYYEIAPLHEVETLRNVLGNAYGQIGRVRKDRIVYMIGRTRLHIDQVENLGAFMELEVVLAEGESETRGIEVAHELMAMLGIEQSALIDRAYVDLLNERAA